MSPIWPTDPFPPLLLGGMALAYLLGRMHRPHRPHRPHRGDRRQLPAQLDAAPHQDAELLREAAARQADAQSLAQEVAFRQDIEESVDVGLLVIDRDGVLTWVNRAFCALSGWPREALLGLGAPLPCWPAPQRDAHAADLQALLTGHTPTQSRVVEYERPDGARWQARVQVRALGRGDGWIVACSDVSREVEDQRRIEAMNELLRRQSAVHLLGERAGELLHKISNHAAACTSACDGMQAWLQQGRADRLADGARLAARAAADMQAIVERFRPWLRAEVAWERLALHEVAADALAHQAGLAATQSVRLEQQVPADLPTVLADRLALGEVLGNLIANGIAAMADTPAAQRLLTIEGLLCEGADAVELRVRDRGHGIPPGLQARVFEQGFTTRAGGTGWGLYICRHWVEELGGQLDIAHSAGIADSAGITDSTDSTTDSTTDGKAPGTTLRVRLPLHARPAPPQADD
jgi:two-component system sensor histidine kinase DctS